MHLTINELLDYTDEERAKWEEWFSTNGNEPLKIALAGETHPSIGALILHCFWADLWYAYMVRDEVLTEESDIVKENKDLPADHPDKIFAFGRFAREAMRAFTDSAGGEEWASVHEVKARGIHIKGSARKLISHILVHEIRHWAQVAIAVRQNGLTPPGDHDLLFSKSFGPLVTRTE